MALPAIGFSTSNPPTWGERMAKNYPEVLGNVSPLPGFTTPSNVPPPHVPTWGERMVKNYPEAVGNSSNIGQSDSYSKQLFTTQMRKIQKDNPVSLGELLNNESLETLAQHLKKFRESEAYVVFRNSFGQLLGYNLINFIPWFIENTSDRLISPIRLNDLQVVSGNYLFKNSARLPTSRDLEFLRDYLARPEINSLKNSLDNIVMMINSEVNIQNRDQIEQTALDSAFKAISEYFSNWRTQE